MPESLDKFDILICCDESMKIKNIEDILRSFKSVKILASKKIENNLDIFDHVLTLPTSVREMNNIIESSVAKKKFSENSSIRIKTYFLDKNEKKLFKEKNFLILTEKEIQLIELLSSKEKPFNLCLRESQSKKEECSRSHRWCLGGAPGLQHPCLPHTACIECPVNTMHTTSATRSARSTTTRALTKRLLA